MTDRTDSTPAGSTPPARFEDALGAVDQAALETLLARGLDASKVDAAQRDRAERIAALLALMDTPTAVNPTLVDVTMARVLRAGRRAAPTDIQLSSEDDEALDAWIASGYDAMRVTSSLRARAGQHQALAGLVTGGEADASSGLADTRLIDQTLAAVDQARSEQSGPYQFRGSWRSQYRLADLVSIAAVLLVAVSVIWPVLSGARSQGTKMACAGNLREVASAMSAYAGSNKDQMPMAAASLGGGRWWDVGSSSGHSNSANLFTLAKSGFSTLTSLACPGNPQACRTTLPAEARDWRRLEEVSYSYQIMFGPARKTLHGPDRAPVLADRSPVVMRAVRGEVIDPWENSTNHGGRGQEILYTDGSAQWLYTPTLKNGDNVWLPRPIEDALRQIALNHGLKLMGTETPEGADDVFLGP